MGTRLDETELRAWQALLHAHHHLTRLLDAELRAEHKLSLGDYDVLLRLVRAPDHALRMTVLADRVMLSPSGLTRVIDELVTRGLVRRDRAGPDARVTLARLTDSGHQLLRKAARTHVSGIRRHMTGRLRASQLRDVAAALEVVTGPHKPH